VEGADERGALFGVGGLLRALRMSKRQVTLPGPLEVATAPKYGLRGHQLGYRPKTNAYDGWSVPMWDQYVRDWQFSGRTRLNSFHRAPTTNRTARCFLFRLCR